MNMLHWSFSAMACKMFPTVGPLLEPWDPVKDALRHAAAGTCMVELMALCIIKGDWMEFCQTFGFPSWKSQTSPCYSCDCTALTIHNDSNVSIGDLPWDEFTDNQYDQVCTTCEIEVELTAVLHKRIANKLKYDVRQGGSHGRALTEDFPSVGLQKGDRLEPCLSLWDVGAFDAIDSFPAQVLFWRPSRETKSRHRNPLYDPLIGICLCLMVVDELHTLYLGIIKNFCAEAIWELCLSNSFFLKPGLNQDEQLDLSCRVFKSKLLEFYRNQAQAGREFTKLQDFTAAFIGKSTQRQLKTKGSETKGFLYCLSSFLQGNVTKLSRHHLWMEAASSLVKMLEKVREGPYVVDARFQQETIYLQWFQQHA